jgi:hypothetical protein
MSLLARAFGARALILACVATVAPIGLTGCDTEEDLGAANNARVVVMHQAKVLGSIDLLANGEKIATLIQGQASEPLTVATGSTLLEVRNTGAEVTVLDVSLELLTQPYLVAVLGETFEDLRFWTVDEPAPERVDGEAVVRVVNLDAGDFTYDVYLDDDQVAPGLAPAKASDFVKVNLGAGPSESSSGSRTARVRVFNAGDDPSGRSLSVAPAEVVLGNRGAYMFVLRTDPENPDVISVTTISP